MIAVALSGVKAVRNGANFILYDITSLPSKPLPFSLSGVNVSALFI
jgi:hypothetical protein